MVKKLSQKDIIDNWDAINNFIQLCGVDLDNGSVVHFTAQGLYVNKSHGTNTPIPKGRIVYAPNKFGSMELTIEGLDPKTHFVQFSTDFCHFKFANGMLTISGKDTFGTGKGDYNIQLFI